VILRPVFFMDNLLAPYSLQGPTLAWALGPGTKLQMIAVEIGQVEPPGMTGHISSLNLGRSRTLLLISFPAFAASCSDVSLDRSNFGYGEDNSRA
jgi:hypothetical protein